MKGVSELTLAPEDYDKAFTEVSFLLDMFIETIVTFVGKSTPSLAVAAGRKMAANLPVHLPDNSPPATLDELVRVMRMQQMDIAGEWLGALAKITLHKCPIGAVCANRQLELGGQACEMFHYYIAGMMAELCGKPTRPQLESCGESCVFTLAFSGYSPA